MVLASALLSLSLFQTAVSPQTEPTIKLAGQDVAIRFPAAPSDLETPAEVLAWPGWTYAKSGLRPAKRPFDAVGDWNAIQAAYLANKDKPDAVAWPTKFVIFEHLKTVEHLPGDLLGLRRGSLNDPLTAEALRAVARFTAMVTAATSGRVKIVPYLSIEEQALADEPGVGEPSFGQPFLERYLGPRVNGGNYVADDKVYRGPYDSIFCLFPLNLASESAGGYTVNGMRVDRISLAQAGGALIGPAESQLYRAWLADVAGRAREKALFTLAAPGMIADGDWAAVAGVDPGPTDQLVQRLGAGRGQAGPDNPVRIPIIQGSTRWPGVSVSIAPDDERGNVLVYSEDSRTRSGGCELPLPTVFDASKTPYLVFWAKSVSKDPLAVRVRAGGVTKDYAILGRWIPPTVGVSLAGGPRLRFSGDGKWQQVAVDLRKLDAAPSDLDTIEFEAPPPAAFSDRFTNGPIEYRFADFQLLTDLPTGLSAEYAGEPKADAAGDEYDRALAAAKLVSASADATVLLSDPNDWVRLNAVARYLDLQDPGVEQPLMDATHSLEPVIGEYALRALANQGTDAAWAAIAKAMAVGNPHEKAVAAVLIGSRKDPKAIPSLSVLFAEPYWPTQKAAAEALGMIPGDVASKTVLVFLHLDDPAIRLAATEAADNQKEFVLRQLEWGAINDPSDAVRSASLLKLIGAKPASARAEGYKGIHDESRWVRIALLQGMAAHPEEAHRPALRIAVLDVDPGVRIAAIQAFAALPGAVEPAELGATLREPRPRVQTAVLDLAEKKHLTLPDDVIAELKASVDPQVAKRAAALGG